MKNILIIGCGLLGSSVLRSIHKNKLANKIFIYEKSKKNISTLKKLKLPGKLVSSLKEAVTKSNFIIFSDSMWAFMHIKKVSNTMTSTM